MSREIVCILRGGPVHEIDGIKFEWNALFGPAVVGKRGEILDNQPGPRHRFWRVVTWWAQQGHRVTDDGVCLYDRTRRRCYVKLAGRQHTEVPEGRDPGDIRRAWFEKLKLPCPTDAPEVIWAEE